jgi:hypothetical protein
MLNQLNKNMVISPTSQRRNISASRSITIHVVLPIVKGFKVRKKLKSVMYEVSSLIQHSWLRLPCQSSCDHSWSVDTGSSDARLGPNRFITRTEGYNRHSSSHTGDHDSHTNLSFIIYHTVIPRQNILRLSDKHISFVTGRTRVYL